MASKYTKLPVNESGPFTPSNNLLQLQMDDIGVSNLAESYLDLEVSFQLANGNDVDSTVTLGDMTGECFYSSAAFIKNMRMEAEKKPFVCEERYRNRLGETMRQFHEGSEERKASEIYGNDKVKIDPTLKRGHCLIPLADLAPIGQVMYPNYAMGKTTLKLELEDKVPLAYLESRLGGYIRGTFALDNISADPADRDITDFVLTQPFPDAETANTYFLNKEFTVAGTIAGVVIPALTKRVVTAVTATANVNEYQVTLSAHLTVPATETATNLTLTIADAAALGCSNIVAVTDQNVRAVTAVGKAPTDFEIGAEYNIGYLEQTTAGLAAGDQYKYVSPPVILLSAVVNAGTNTNVDLTFSTVAFALAAGKTAAQMFVSIVDYNQEALTYKVHKCDLVLAKPIKWEAMKEFSWETNSLEMVNVPATTDWRRQYELEAECDSLKLVMPLATLISERDNITAYRNAINSIDTTTEDVLIDNTNNGSLYYDMLLKNNDDIVNLQPLNGQLEVIAITERVSPPEGSLNNVIEFRITASNPMTAKVAYLYKHLNKSIKL